MSSFCEKCIAEKKVFAIGMSGKEYCLKKEEETPEWMEFLISLKEMCPVHPNNSSSGKLFTFNRNRIIND